MNIQGNMRYNATWLIFLRCTSPLASVESKSLLPPKVVYWRKNNVLKSLWAVMHRTLKHPIVFAFHKTKWAPFWSSWHTNEACIPTEVSMQGMPIFEVDIHWLLVGFIFTTIIYCVARTLWIRTLRLSATRKENHEPKVQKDSLSSPYVPGYPYHECTTSRRWNWKLLPLASSFLHSASG